MSPKRLLVAGLVLFLAVGGVFALGHRPAVAGGNEDTGQLTDEQLETVVAYIVAAIKADPSKISFDDEEIAKATGIRIPEGAGPIIQASVLRALVDQGIQCAANGKKSDGATCAVSRCSEYAACSLHSDLSRATGEMLEMYKREKNQDGAEYSDFTLPAFEAVDLEGNKVTSADLAGRPAVLVLLAGHCGHSIGSIGILQKVADDVEDEDVRIVGIFLNSGTSKQVKGLVDLYKVDYEIWVYPDESLGDLFGSHLVPTYLYVDAEGSVKKKLVGMKEEKEINEFVAAFSE